MNKTIKNTRVVDHSRTESILKEIMANVRKQGYAYVKYTEKMDESKDQSMYSAQYLKGFADKALENLVAVAQGNADSFVKLIAEAKEVEVKNASVTLNIADPSIQSAMMIINTMGEKMDIITFESIVKPFIGQENALDFISKVLKKHGIESFEKMKKFFYDSNTIFEPLSEALMSMAFAPKDIVAYQTVQREVVEVATKLGIELSDADLEVGIPSDSIFLKNIKMAAGLKEEELAD